MKVRYSGTLLPKIYSNLVFRFATEVVEIKTERPWYEGCCRGGVEVLQWPEVRHCTVGRGTTVRSTRRHVLEDPSPKVNVWPSIIT